MRVLVLVAACAPAPAPLAPPVTSSVPVPDAAIREISLDLGHLPAGPYASAAAYCARWKPPHERVVTDYMKMCQADPDAEDCHGGCGPGDTCDVQPLGSGAVGPFRRVELVELDSDGCNAGACYLALTDARGTWFVDEIAACTGGEGISAYIETQHISGSGAGLTWQYHQHVRDNDVTDVDVTVRCAGSPPACTDDEP